MTIKAYAAFEAKGELKPFEYEAGELGAFEIEIDVDHCGICHSDVSMIDNDWGMAQYPLVAGHEVIGRVAALGSHVSHLAVGDVVGLGWHAGYCQTCRMCMGGDHNLCNDAQGTIVERHGGFANKVRAQAMSAVKIPAGLNPATAGPLLCGGITVYNPLVQFNVSPQARVAVVGIGGLGHLAVQFLRAWGCEVTAFSSNPSKEQELRAMGAHHVLNSKDAKALKKAAGRFDLILSTVNVKLDWNAYVATLAPKGRLHFVGATLEPLDIGAFGLIGGQRSISGSPVGSPRVIEDMLNFAALHNIEPIVEPYRFSQINEALDKVRNGSPRFRVVLSH
ncbi:NAD(P)-dependent alcohol dehydrogenase [Limnobacter sp.]|uniref:NADPH-dependent aldehyde reductase Ahr n=1 Tax=Limnobacter sp. TaxID=2003368 RepID=UPI00351512FD